MIGSLIQRARVGGLVFLAVLLACTKVVVDSSDTVVVHFALGGAVSGGQFTELRLFVEKKDAAFLAAETCFKAGYPKEGTQGGYAVRAEGLDADGGVVARAGAACVDRNGGPIQFGGAQRHVDLVLTGC